MTREVSLQVRDQCLCFRAQRAARTLARRFDEAFRSLDLTNGQFSLMMCLNRPDPPSLGQVARVLAMDRTTLTAALKALQRKGLVRVVENPEDRRSRLLSLTRQGRALLARAVPIWQTEHGQLERELGLDPSLLRQVLERLA